MSSSDEDALFQGDKDDIRKKLSEISYRDLLQLKEKLGKKVYNAALGHTKKPKELKSFKRENKNRPREESAKRPVPRFREIIPVKKKIVRDPRFDSLCGEFNEKAFKNSYAFLNQVKENDLKKLYKELKYEQSTEPDEDGVKRIKKIKYLIQRLENQLREEKRKNEKHEKELEEKQEIKEAIKRGEKPTFKKKSEKRLINLVSQYEELKNTGKLKKHIDRFQRKNKRKEFKRMERAQLLEDQ